MSWTLLRAAGLIAKVPRPGGDVAFRVIGELHIQRDLTTSWISREVGLGRFTDGPIEDDTTRVYTIADLHCYGIG